MNNHCGFFFFLHPKNNPSADSKHRKNFKWPNLKFKFLFQFVNPILNIFRQQSESRDTQINVKNNSVCFHCNFIKSFIDL